MTSRYSGNQSRCLQKSQFLANELLAIGSIPRASSTLLYHASAIKALFNMISLCIRGSKGDRAND